MRATVPITDKQASNMASRVRGLVTADPSERLPEYWVQRIGLNDAEERRRVLEIYNRAEYEE